MNMERIEDRVNEVCNIYAERMQISKKRFEEIQMKIELIKKTRKGDREAISSANETINKLIDTNNDLLAKLNEMKTALHKDEKEYENLKEELFLLQTEVEKKEHLCRLSQEETKMTNEDKIVLQKFSKKYQCYKDVTNLVWDYSAPKNVIRGYVRNKETGHSQAFEFNKDQQSHSEIVQKLWSEIALASN